MNHASSANPILARSCPHTLRGGTNRCHVINYYARVCGDPLDKPLVAWNPIQVEPFSAAVASRLLIAYSIRAHRRSRRAIENVAGVAEPLALCLSFDPAMHEHQPRPALASTKAMKLRVEIEDAFFTKFIATRAMRCSFAFIARIGAESLLRLSLGNPAARRKAFLSFVRSEAS